MIDSLNRQEPAEEESPEIVERMPPKGRRKYPWDEWFDGRMRKLTRGRHYHCKDETMAGNARDVGRRRGYDVDASYNSETGHVWIHRVGPCAAESHGETPAMPRPVDETAS